MRIVRSATQPAYGIVVSFVALLFLTASPMMSAPYPRATIQKAAEPVSNEYLIMLNVPASNVPNVAAELTKRYGGEVLAVWQHAVTGFWLKAEPEVARRMLQDRRIRSCEENAVGHDSAAPQPTGAGVKPTPSNTPYPSLGTPDNPLWHLNRISHRQRQDDPSSEHDFNYRYGSDGSGVDIYVIDEGVLPWHQEFYPESTEISTITNEAIGVPVTSEDGLFRALTSRVISFAGANIMANRLPGIEVLDNAGNPVLGGVDEITPEARPASRNAIAPLPCNSLNPYGFPDGSLTHGTACASAAAGRNVGVAKGATIIPVRIYTCARPVTHTTVGATISGLDWTAESVRNRHRPAVVSMSTFFFLNPANLVGHLDLVILGQPLKVLNSAITTLTDMGVPVVASANNQHGTACDTSPAILSIRAGGHVITVGGLSKNSDTAWVNRDLADATDRGSNFGRCVDIWAPAEDITVATMTNSSNGFAYRTAAVSGTSFSAPIVAGIIARLMSENHTLYAEPTRTVRKIYELLTSSATRITDSDADFLSHFGDSESPKLIAYIGAVQITTQPASVTFGNDPGETHDLSVSVHGAGTTYQWYEGEPGNISTPRGTATSSNKTTLTAVDVPIGAIKRYWVRVKQPCGDDATVLCTADSVAATAKHDCSIDVRVDAEFLTGIRHSTSTETDVEPETPPQSVRIVARAAGAGPYQYAVRQVTSNGAVEFDCGSTHLASAGESDDPDVPPGDQSIVEILAPSNVAATYTVTFTTGGTCPFNAAGVICSGSKTVTVSVCDQPKIKALSSVVWRLAGLSYPQTTMLDEAHTTGSDQATFQWFRGTYTSFAPVYNAVDPKTLERAKQPLFIAHDDGLYWARVDGRCGSAVSKLIPLISCFRYTDGALTVNLPLIPVANGRPLVLGAKLVTSDGAFDAAHYSWSSTAPFTSGADPSSIIVTPTDLSGRSVYHLDVSNATGDCSVPTRNISIETRDCHLIATAGQPQSQIAGANGATLSVTLESGVQNAAYQWFAEPGSWTWTTTAPSLHALGDQATFTGQAGHRYFVRVTANCPNGGPQIIEDSNFASVTHSLPRHRAVGPAVKRQEKGETYVILSAMNATTVLSVPAEVQGATYEWRSGDQYADQDAPLATGTTYQVTGAGLYWVRTIPLTGDYTDSAVIRLVWNPPVPVTVSPGTVIGTNSTLHLTAEYPNPPAGTIYEWRQAVDTDQATFVEDLTMPVLNGANSRELVRTGLVGHATFWVRVVAGGAEYHSDPILIVAACELLPTVVALMNPIDHYVTAGQQATLFAVGTGTDLTYQWFRGLLGDTSHQISSSSSYNGSFGTDETYWVRVTDGCGQTADASINIYGCKPIITGLSTQPANGVIGPNETAQITVTATPAQWGHDLVYQWYAGNTVFPIDLATNPTAKSRTFVADHAGTYLASVSGVCGDNTLSGVISAGVNIGACVPPAVDALLSRDVDRALPQALTVNATGVALTYQWYVGLTHDTSNPIAGGTTATIVPQPSDTTDYWVRVTDQGVAACSTDSGTSHRTVCAPPAITTQPVGSSVFSGASVTLTVAATAATQAPLHYAWIEVDVDGNLVPVSGNDLPSFTTPPITASRTWFVRVFSGSLLSAYTDSVRATIHLCDLPAVQWATPPSPVSVGTPVTLQIYAPQAGPKMYWYQGVSGDTVNSTLLSGPIDATYTQVIPAAPSTSYWVRVQKDSCYSDSATLTLNVCVPTITQQPSAAAITLGGSAALSVTATTAPLTYQWYTGASGDVTQPVPAATAASYTASPAADTLYWVRVTGSCGVSADSNAVLVSVCVPPAIASTAPASQWLVLGSGSATAWVNATGSNLTYQWYFGNSGNTASPMSAITSSLTVTPQNTTSYWVRVTGSCGTPKDSVTMVVNVCGAPAITAQPQGSTVTSGGTATLSVSASETTTAPMTYQWYRGVSGDTSTPLGTGLTSFTTPALTANTPFWVRVSCGVCTPADSQTATVSVCDNAQTLAAPADQYIAIGQTATLTATATGNVYQWYVGASGNTSQPAPGTSTLSSYAAVPSVTTQYWVRIQNGVCIFSTASATVNVCIPAITQQPAGLMINPGTSTTLSVAANTPGLTYQWYTGNSGTTTSPISGATASSVTVSPATATNYWVRVTGSCAQSVDSATATVTICTPPTINGTSPTQSIVRNSSTSCFVTAAGTSLTYQWYVGASGDTTTPIAGATASSVTVTPQNTASYWARVTGTCGTINSATMLVNVCATPAITAQPQGSTIFSGGTATMSVTATEATTAAVTYQWYRGVSGDVSAPVGTSSPSFTTPALTVQTSYWVRVACGTCNPADSVAATVSICTYPQTLSAPADQFIAIGQSATLSTAIGSGNVYQWYIGTSGNTSQPAPGTSNLSSYTATPSVTTQYWAQIQNGGCISRTNSATVNICVPTITQQPASIMINPGASTTLSVAANTSGLTYQWYTGNSGATTVPISGATASTVTVSPSAATNYWVRVTGSCSRTVDSATAAVTICAPPAINGTSPTQSIVRNSSTSCFVTAAGTNLTYQWYVGASGTTTTPIAGATASSVTVTPQNTTSYWARVTGTCGTINSVAMLVNVCAVPAITAQPQGSIIFSGSTATMSVTATEATTSAVTYQWYRGASGDVSAPVGTNSTTFTTPALTAQTNYWVRVSCSVCNPADSQTATVSICYYPQNLISPGDFYTTVGQTVRLTTSNAAGNTYQWYTGATGDTSHPYTSPNSPNMYYADVAPTVTTQYWAQVQNGGCISRTAAGNVYVCVPTFTQQPAGATITPGSSTTLSSSANTAGVTYQWYTGASGNTAAPIGGATGSSVTVTPGSDTSYWVRATGTCGRTTDSATATVVLCSPPVITAQPMGSAVQGGGATASMWVYATGSNLAYQWYVGESGDMSTPITGATASTSSMWVSATQKAWVRITGSCGAVNSNATFVSVYPVISQQPPASLVVGYDTTASISLAASGSYLSYVWKNGSGSVIGTTTTPTFITPSITADTTIYCQVFSGNAATNSWSTSLSVCYNQPNVTLVNAPNGACRMLYTTTNTADDYQWYQGARGDTSHFIGSGGTSLTVCPSSPTQYWVRAVVWSSYQVVSCYADSNAVTAP
jgi:hypothetical protein